ncbi:DUF6913 domain-containing protein [Winogradskyella sp. PG-2]|uniref:DUF6913 domain-containing protein n=1 Tax=Winogradskyella sp. PG-2 TaxID=754409 RepID=UPI0004588260|nr:hypothetical protein [Winogradskyella sp. PG-2]BAO77742.1 hypothetical protein WPG_3512 [Winogradskyella sp. PG-2]
MILKAFKEKSNQKYVNKLLTTRKAVVNSNKVKTIAVLLNANEFNDFEAFRQYFKDLNLTSPKHKIIAFTNDDKFVSSQWESYVSPKDFGWNGIIKHKDLLLFTEETYDVLISYYKDEVLPLKLITATSMANLKVGISRNDERLYDLIIDVLPKEIETFKREFKKYLNILNKL